MVEVDEEASGKFLTIGSPIKFSSFMRKIIGAPLSEHSDEVLTKLGCNAEQIAKMRSGQII